MPNLYFRPTKLYKEYLILEMIHNNQHVTQREMSRLASASVSMVNMYLDEYEAAKYIRREKHSTRDVEYFLTKSGVERMRVLNIRYLMESQLIYRNAKAQIMNFLNLIIKKGIKDIILYGVGEVADVIIETIYQDKTIPINIVGLIDDDITKQGKTIHGVDIDSINMIDEINHELIIISTYTSYDLIYNKLIKINYPKDKIEYFFK